MNIHGIQSVGTLTQQAGGFATLSGSFTGSFKGDGSQLTNLPSQSFDSGSLISTASFNAYTASTNLFTQSANQRLTAIESVSGSWITEAETASFARTNVDNNFTANQTFTNITAVSASFTYVQTLYETSSVIYSSGSNQFGDELTDVQTLSGSVLIVGSGSINGNRILTTADTASLSALSASFALTSSITRNVVVVARNNNASTLPAGTVVHITSAVGDNPVFTTASYDTEALSSNTFGLLRYSSAPGADVEVVVTGVVTGVNTDPALGYTAGDILYLSSSGQFTRVQPQAPNQIVTLGQVLRAQQNNGSIYVSINNGWELNELHNVQITNPQTNNLLAYESASYGLWKNKTYSQLGLATTGSNTFNGDQYVNGFVSASNGFYSGPNTTALSIGDGANVRFISGSNFYNVQLVPGVGDIAFSRDGVSNVKVFTLAGAAGNNTTFQNNPVEFQSNVGGVTMSTPLIINAGINSNVNITGSLKLSSSANIELEVIGNSVFTGSVTITGSTNIIPATVSTNAQYVIPFISGSTISKDSVDTLFYNPASNQLQVSASSGTANIGTVFVTIVSGSGTSQYSSGLSKNAVNQVSSPGYFIGMSGNPSQIGTPGLTSTNPAILASSGSTQYAAIELQPSQSFTDGRVTFPRNVAMLQNLEITGSLTSSLQQGYVWVGDVNGRTTTVATSSFGTSINTGSFATTGSNTFNGNQIISGSIQVSGSISLRSEGADGFAYSGKALFLTNSVQTGITVESPIHFYQVGKGDFYITNNVAGVGSGSINMIAANNANLNISASTTIVNGKFTNNTPTASNESQIDFVKLPTFVGANGTTYSNSTFSLGDYASSGIDQTFFIEYANSSFEKYSALYVGPSRTQFLIGTGTGYDYDVIELLDNNNNTTTAKVKADTVILQGTTQLTGSLILSSSAATELQVIGNSVFTGSVAGNVVSASITSNTASIDFNLGNYFEVTSSVTPLRLNVTNITPGRTSTLIISASASSSITFSSNVAQPSGSAYSGSAGSIDILSLVAFNTSKVNLVSTKALV